VLRQRNRNNVLVALVIGLVGVLEVAGVLDGDLLASLGDGAVALLKNGLGDTHCDGGVVEEALGSGGDACKRSGRGGSEGLGQGKHVEEEREDGKLSEGRRELLSYVVASAPRSVTVRWYGYESIHSSTQSGRYIGK
jgi:hypothetical protein